MLIHRIDAFMRFPAGEKFGDVFPVVQAQTIKRHAGCQTGYRHEKKLPV
jgi:hypothetical protein